MFVGEQPRPEILFCVFAVKVFAGEAILAVWAFVPLALLCWNALCAQYGRRWQQMEGSACGRVPSTCCPVTSTEKSTLHGTVVHETQKVKGDKGVADKMKKDAFEKATT